MPELTDADGECACEFDPYDDDPEESYHFKRTCPECGAVWWSLHCVHDGGVRLCFDCDPRRLLN